LCYPRRGVRHHRRAAAGIRTVCSDGAGHHRRAVRFQLAPGIGTDHCHFIVVFSSVSPLAEPGSAQFISLVLTLTFLTGVFQLIMGLARMGVLVNFISHTVVIALPPGRRC